MGKPGYLLIYVFCLFFSYHHIFPQDVTKNPLPDTASGKAASMPDTSNAGQDSTASLVFKPKKTPMLALGLSALLPGAGQIYTKNYWKVPIIWGVGGYWLYEWITLNNKYSDFRDSYLRSKNGQDLKLRDFYRDERDKFAWFMAALYILNLMDAYADAHLYDFDVGPDLTSAGILVASIRFRF